MPRSRFSLVVLLGLLAAGCTTAADYGPPASAFGEGVKAATTAFSSYARVVDDITFDRTMQVATTVPNAISISPGDCVPGGASKRCRLMIQDGREAAPRLLTPGAASPHLHAVLEDLDGYAEELSEVANAGFEAEIRGASEGLKASVLALAASAEALAPASGRQLAATAAAEQVDGPVGTTAHTGTKRIDGLRIRELRRWTGIVSPQLPQIMAALKGVTLEHQRVQQAELHAQFVAAQAAYAGGRPDAERVERYRGAAAAYDASLAMEVEPLFDALTRAHQELATALATPGAGLDGYWAQIHKLAEETDKVEALVGAPQVAPPQ